MRSPPPSFKLHPPLTLQFIVNPQTSNSLTLYRISLVYVNDEEPVVKKEETAEEDPLSGSNDMMNQDPLEVVGTEVKKEIEDQIPIKEEYDYEDRALEADIDILVNMKTEPEDFESSGSSQGRTTTPSHVPGIAPPHQEGVALPQQRITSEPARERGSQVIGEQTQNDKEGGRNEDGDLQDEEYWSQEDSSGWAIKKENGANSSESDDYCDHEMPKKKLCARPGKGNGFTTQQKRSEDIVGGKEVPRNEGVVFRCGCSVVTVACRCCRQKQSCSKRRCKHWEDQQKSLCQKCNKLFKNNAYLLKHLKKVDCTSVKPRIRSLNRGLSGWMMNIMRKTTIDGSPLY